MSADISTSARAVASPHALAVDVAGQTALLHTRSEIYFGLDEVGTRIWSEVTGAASIDAALARLNDIFDVEPERLREDVLALLRQLEEHDLVDIQP
jgi:hypothetical protein